MADDSSEQALAGLGLSGNLNRNLELRLGYQNTTTVSGDSFQDNEYSAVLAWHFRKPKAPELEPEPAPKPERH